MSDRHSFIYLFTLFNEGKTNLANIKLLGPREIWGEWLLIFRELGSTGNYFRNLGSKLIVFGFGVPCKKVKKKLTLKEKPSFRLIFKEECQASELRRRGIAAQQMDVKRQRVWVQP